VFDGWTPVFQEHIGLVDQGQHRGHIGGLLEIEDH